MLKNISNLKGAKTLNKQSQKIIGGRPRPSRGPCGETGGMPISWSQDRCFGYGIVWYNGQCYACY
jgi:hypothetical protein